MDRLLKALRERNGWSVVEAAERIGVTRATVYSWENGDKEPEKPALRSLCEAYGATDTEREELAKLRAFGADADLPPAA